MRRLFYIVGLWLLLGGCATADSTGRSKAARTGGKSKSSAGVRKKPARARKSRNKGPSTDVPKTYKPRRTACEKYSSIVRRVAGEHDLEPELVMALVKVESSFNPECKSRVGARGLMQVMPRTGKHMKCGTDLHDPETNVECGCRVLKRYLKLYDGNLIYALSAYNAGPGNANPSARGRYLPFNFKYVEKIFRWRNVFVRFGCR